MLKRVRERAKDESGFSLAEILAVCMIIGILAVAGAPNFVCQRQRADDSRSKAVARTAAAAMEAYANDNLGAYDGATASILHAIESSVPTNMEVTPYANCSGPDNTCYVVNTPPNPTSGNRFKLTKKLDGKLLSDCSSHSIGGCPSDGKWSAE
jgi:prepilin-type N-terminal cleavage/methylation domain-containing protein